MRADKSRVIRLTNRLIVLGVSTFTAEKGSNRGVWTPLYYVQSSMDCAVIATDGDLYLRNRMMDENLILIKSWMPRNPPYVFRGNGLVLTGGFWFRMK